jgi:hypothetical protein
MQSDPSSIYLNDHPAGSTAGAVMARRVAGATVRITPVSKTQYLAQGSAKIARVSAWRNGSQPPE